MYNILKIIIIIILRKVNFKMENENKKKLLIIEDNPEELETNVDSGSNVSENKIIITVLENIKEQINNVKIFSDIDRQTFEDILQGKGQISIGKVMGNKEIWRIKKPGKRLRLFGSMEGCQIVVDSIEVRNERTYRKGI